MPNSLTNFLDRCLDRLMAPVEAFDKRHPDFFMLLWFFFIFSLIAQSI